VGLDTGGPAAGWPAGRGNGRGWAPVAAQAVESAATTIRRTRMGFERIIG
jgi:hypothetical protein